MKKQKSVFLLKEINIAVNFLKEVQTELRKVVWPTRQETIKLTAIVVIVSILVSLYIGFLDYGFTNLVDRFVIR